MAQDRQEIERQRQKIDRLEAELNKAQKTPDAAVGDPDKPRVQTDAPNSAGTDNARRPEREPAQPRWQDFHLPAAQKDAEAPEQKGDRPGWWSNAKAGLYGAVGSTAVLTAADQFAPWAPHTVVDLVTGGIAVVAAALPTAREGWRKGKHGD